MKKQNHLLPSVPIPVPYGAAVVESGVQFTLFSRHATRVWLMLFKHADAEQPWQEYELRPDTHRIGDIWHIHVERARAGHFYLYRMEGEAPDGSHNFYDPEQWVLDPFALAVAGSPKWGETWRYRPSHHVKNGAAFPKGVIVRDDFDWSKDRTLRTPLSETVIYETHVRGYTAHSTSKVRHPGTYRGLIEKLPYIRKLGVTAIELLPVHEFNEMEYFIENTTRAKLRNFWGYSTLAFFAPHARYSSRGVHGQQVREFKELVLACHQAGIEVILDVVFNHTAEGGYGGPTYSFRGVDNAVYYMMEKNGRDYRNFTGCGNTVNCNHPVVRDFIIDCLRYWVLHMHVDGFRFDLASVLTRGPQGEVLPNPSVVEHIAEDPVLRDTKLIAEAWDAAGLYQVGSFPNKRWSEWNGRYRDDIRQFWRGNKGMLRPLTARLLGSPDLYDRNQQTPQKSVNFVTCHDGFTLYDVVAYNTKYNHSNCEDNRDGENHNHSYNYGHEGPTGDGHIRAVRKRQMKNLMATIFLSQGVPMILAGDEFARTQHGNNNAYCQDSEISWVDWSLLPENQDLKEFVRDVIALRKSQPALRRERFLATHPAAGSQARVAWLAPAGGEPDWENGHAIGMLLATGSGDAEPDTILALFNAADEAVHFTLPAPPGKPWTLALSTDDRIQPRRTVKTESIELAGRTTLVLISSPA